jgi:predicted RNA-binding protein with PUA-like domain
MLDLPPASIGRTVRICEETPLAGRPVRAPGACKVGSELAMAHWLFKSEPSAWSFDKLARLGAAGTDWSGVRNHSAKLNMQAMKVGEQGFFYHSNEGKAIVGIVEVCKAYRPDPTDPSGKFGMVDIRAVRPLPRPVTLEEVKSDKQLAEMALVTNSRLSVQPVNDAEWAHVLKLGGL